MKIYAEYYVLCETGPLIPTHRGVETVFYAIQAIRTFPIQCRGADKEYYNFKNVW